MNITPELEQAVNDICKTVERMGSYRSNPEIAFHNFMDQLQREAKNLKQVLEEAQKQKE